MIASQPIRVPEHQPFPIADSIAGLYLAKEPWLAPVNAFTTMKDAFLFRSRLRQRTGFQRFAQCSQATAVTSAPSGTPSDITYVLLNDATYLNLESPVFTYNDATNGALTTELGTWGEIDGQPGVWGVPIFEASTTTQLGWVQQRYADASGLPVAARARVQWDLHSGFTTGDVTGGSMAFEEDPRLPITAIRSYTDTSGSEYLIATNTRRIFEYSATSNQFEDVASSDIYTGDPENLFWTWPAEDDLILTNGIDAVQKFNGSSSTIADLVTTIGTGPDTIRTSQLVVLFKSRLIHLGTTEGAGATRYPRRARWSRASAFETYDTEDFTDAPTDLGDVVTARKIADRLYVGFEEGWMELRFTGDEQSLFEFEETTYIFGASARLGSVSDGARILARTVNGIQAVDPNAQYAADGDIPDYTLQQMDPSNAPYTIATRALPNRQFWFSMVNRKATADSPNEVLVATYQEDERLNWSTFDLDFTAFGQSRRSLQPNWDDVDTNWDDYGVLWDQAGGSSDLFVLTGDSAGQIAQARGSQDQRSDVPLTRLASEDVLDPDEGGFNNIPFEITTARLSPYPGQRARLGWVDFYIEAANGVTLTIEFRGDTRLSAYLTRTIDISPTSTAEKIMRRVKVGKSATFHSITIKAEGAPDFAIEAIVPWFRPAGRLRSFA